MIKGLWTISERQAEETNNNAGKQEADQLITIIDPYEEKLFEMFGLGIDFPKPEVGYKQQWHYRTEQLNMNTQGGGKKEVPGRYVLELTIKPGYYKNYQDAIITYLKKCHFELSHNGEWRGVGVAYMDGDRILRCQFAPERLMLISSPRANRIL